MLHYTTYLPMSHLKLPRKVYLKSYQVPSYVTPERMRYLLLSPYDDGNPSEFQDVSVGYLNYISIKTEQTMWIQATFADHLDEQTLYAYLSKYTNRRLCAFTPAGDPSLCVNLQCAEETRSSVISALKQYRKAKRQNDERKLDSELKKLLNQLFDDISRLLHTYRQSE